jgi:N-acetylmuramoyl-L-alanine amidase
MPKPLTPNYDDVVIPVEFIVIHYTAGTLDRALKTFTNPKTKVSCHIIIDEMGREIELVPCKDGITLRAWHAGDSYYLYDRKEWLQFNDFSIGIELVNKNGNIFAYTEAQYRALANLVKNLQTQYPALSDPQRILGHEHIAGFRGKADPGIFFDWSKFYALLFPTADRLPSRDSVCPKTLGTALSYFRICATSSQENDENLWRAVSRVTEAAVALACEKTQK